MTELRAIRRVQPLPVRAAFAGDIESRARRLATRQSTVEAVTLALEHGLDDLAAELLAAGSTDLVRTAGDHAAFFEMVERLGAERIHRWPQLDAAAIWALTMGNRLRQASVRLDELEARIPELRAEGRSFVADSQRTPFDRVDPATDMPCWVGMMRALIAAFASEGERALQLAAQWRHDFPRAPEYEHATVCCATLQGYQLAGRWADSEREARRALAIFSDARTEYGIAWSATGLGYTLFKQGRVGAMSALLDDALHRVSGLGRPTHTQFPLRLAECFVLFERGEFAALMARAGAELREYPSPMLALGQLRMAVWTLMAVGRAAEALALLDQAQFQGSEAAQQWWDREIAIERARAAAVSGNTDRRWYTGPASERVLLDLLAASCGNPTPAHLRALRPLLLAAEEGGDACAVALLLFAKARIEHETGQALQARRSVVRLLTSPLTRERIGTLASLAPGLRPLFDEVLASLLRDRASTSEGLQKLAVLIGVVAAAEMPATAALALSKRERQIADALLEGLANRDIAERLHLTEQTVKWHLWNLFRKLGVRNRTGAARVLVKLGLG